jgi:hypothetical protein
VRGDSRDLLRVALLALAAAGNQKSAIRNQQLTAEGVGFEPTRACALPVFKTGAINHSTTPPGKVPRPRIVLLRQSTPGNIVRLAVRHRTAKCLIAFPPRVRADRFPITSSHRLLRFRQEIAAIHHLLQSRVIFGAFQLRLPNSVSKTSMTSSLSSSG